MKKRLLAVFLTFAAMLSLAACSGYPDGKKLVEEAVKNKDAFTHADVDMHFSLDRIVDTGVSMSMAVDVNTQLAAEASVIDMAIKVMGVSVKDTLYLDPRTSDLYFRGVDGAWYRVEAESLLGVDPAISVSGQLSAQGLAVLVPLCSEIKTVGRETLDQRSVYKVRLILDGKKLLSFSLSAGGSSQIDYTNAQLQEIEKQMQQLMEAFQIFLYIESDTPRLAGMEMTIDKSAVKKFITSTTADAEVISQMAGVIDGMDVRLSGTYHYDPSTLSLPAETKTATLLTDEDEIVKKMPLLSIFSQFQTIFPAVE